MSSFRIPPIIKALFDSFPLLIIPNDPLPAGCPKPSPEIPTLYIFTTPEDAARGNPSFSPSCLKWQTYLKFCGIDYKVIPSNNHASPSGMLPFLTTAGTVASMVPSNRLEQWARQNGDAPRETSVENPQGRAFLSLVNSQLRDAWLYALFLEPNNFLNLSSVYYRTTAVSVVNILLSHQMQSAATQELLQARPGGVISADDIYADAESAVSALSTVLGDDEWFFGGKEAGLFDATLFGYLHLILTLKWDEKEAGLARAVKKHQNLVDHEERVRVKVYPNASKPSIWVWVRDD